MKLLRWSWVIVILYRIIDYALVGLFQHFLQTMITEVVLKKVKFNNVLLFNLQEIIDCVH